MEAALRRLAIPVSTSHRILPEFREYERASTTVVNAALSPLMQGYLLRTGREHRAAVLRTRGSDAVFGRHRLGAPCGAGARAHGAVRSGGRRDWCVASGAMGGPGQDHRV